MVAAQKRVAPNRRHMSAGEYADAMARSNALWDHIPGAYKEIPEGEDPHDHLDLLNEQEKHDREDFRQGRTVVCACTQKIQEEEKAERIEAGYEEREEDEESDFA